MESEIFFYILIRSWKAFDNFDRCIDSVLGQTYIKYKILFIDDATPLSKNQKKYIKNKLKGHVVIFNSKRLYSLHNAYKILHRFAKKNQAVVFNLDGDDWLLNKRSLSEVAGFYRKNPTCLLTYGECVLWDGKKISGKPSRLLLPNVNIPYKNGVIADNSYRLEPFYPLHPRTWKVWLFKKIRKKDFIRPNGTWLQFAEDQAIFFPMLEMAGGNYLTIKKPIYVHNFEHQYSDLKANLIGLLRDELVSRKRPKYEPLP